MTWFKVDDGFWRHPKIDELSAAALALWLVAGTYCADQLTNGIVKLARARLLPHFSPEAAAELVTAGLWHEVEGGFEFHDWQKYQPTKEAVTSQREARKTFSEAGNHRRWHAGRDKFDPACPLCVESREVSRTGSPTGSPTGSTTGIPPVPSPILSTHLSISDADVETVKLCARSHREIGRTLTDDEARALAADILMRATSPIRSRAAYLRKAMVGDPVATRTLIDNMRPSQKTRRPATCDKHAEYPLPCIRCAEETKEGTT